jgi:phosphodiesterase/alkaline phosphatase D-like protein
MSVTLGWQAIAQATGYTVQTAIDPNFSSPSDLNVSKTAATVTGLHPATSYWFRVRATTGPSDSGWSAPVSVTTTGKPRK